MRYRLEASNNRKEWHHQATFTKGQDSRFGVPFDAAVVIKEAEAFAEARIDDFMYVRVIIELDSTIGSI